MLNPFNIRSFMIKENSALWNWLPFLSWLCEQRRPPKKHFFSPHPLSRNTFVELSLSKSPPQKSFKTLNFEYLFTFFSFFSEIPSCVIDRQKKPLTSLSISEREAINGGERSFLDRENRESPSRNSETNCFRFISVLPCYLKFFQCQTSCGSQKRSVRLLLWCYTALEW